MLRRALLLVPLVAVVAAGVAIVLRDAPAVAIGTALVLGVATAVGLAAPADRRLHEVADRSQAALQRRQNELTAERTRVQRLLDSLDTAVMLFEPEGLVYANPAAQELFGVPRAEPRSPLQSLGVEGLAAAIAEARESRSNVDIEVVRDDRQLSAHASASGENVVALVVSDVTESRRLDAIRRDFVTNASHELKTPVAGMQALADSLALAVERDPDRARSMVRRMQSEAARLAKMVNELLDLARIEEDSAAAALRQRVDLAAIVRAEVAGLDAAATQRGVTVSVECPAPAWLVANAEDLRLIVANLLENAVRYNRNGGEVELRVQRRGAQVILEVEDNGIGIPEADRDRIFERFYRVDKPRSRAAGGTGLGLSIVRNAAERQGGEVSVSSVLGFGSTFRVVLPVAADPA